MQKAALAVKNVLFSGLNGKTEAVRFGRHGAVEVVTERTRGKIGPVEVERDRAVGIRSTHQKPANAVGGITARRV